MGSHIRALDIGTLSTTWISACASLGQGKLDIHDLRRTLVRLRLALARQLTWFFGERLHRVKIRRRRRLYTCANVTTKNNFQNDFFVLQFCWIPNKYCNTYFTYNMQLVFQIAIYFNKNLLGRRPVYNVHRFICVQITLSSETRIVPNQLEKVKWDTEAIKQTRGIIRGDRNPGKTFKHTHVPSQIITMHDNSKFVLIRCRSFSWINMKWYLSSATVTNFAKNILIANDTS